MKTDVGDGVLTLTRRVEYALIALGQMAKDAARVFSARELAEKYAISAPLLMNVLKELQRAGLVHSTRGSRGGYRLTRPAKAISLTQVIEAVEAPVRVIRCAEPAADGAVGCELAGCCPVRAPLRRLHDRLSDFLKSVTVADLAADEQYVELAGIHAPARAIGK
ncbi:MAG: Rrf2 family transcriptional regulator [Phycisphaerales bacterium]|nr:Rrf2 family transcriptional regulator [Phycisphaerales bacterium]